MRLLLSCAGVALAFSICVSNLAFAESQSRGNGLPPGVEDNQGLEGYGQGETRGNHYGWDKNKPDRPEQAGQQGRPSHGGPGDMRQGQRPMPNPQGGMMPPPPMQMGHMEQGQQGCNCPCGHGGGMNSSQMRPPQMMGGPDRQGSPGSRPPMAKASQPGERMEPRPMNHRPPRFEAPGYPPEHEIPGNAYGNDGETGNGGQMGNSHSPHR